MSRGIITNNNNASDNVYKVKIDNITYSAQGVTKDELNTGDVNIIDYYNKTPSDAASWGLRVLPNKGEYIYKTDKIWKRTDELVNNNCKHELFRAFFLSCEENQKWQDEKPLYKSGIVTEIIDSKYMKVRISPTNYIAVCRCDYMTCDTGAFEENDVAVIKYTQPSLGIAVPVVVGFWKEPKNCFIFLEPWGDLVCENNTWRFGWTLPECQLPEDTYWYDDTEVIGSMKTRLANGILSSVGTGRSSISYSCVEFNESIANKTPRTLKIQIESEVAITTEPEGAASYFLLQLYDKNDSDQFVEYVFILSGDTNISEHIYIGDNNGKEQTIDLTQYYPANFSYELAGVAFGMWCVSGGYLYNNHIELS